MGVSRGFTLMEVLIAVAVLGIGATAALKAGLLAQDGLITAQGMEQSLVLARQKLAEVEDTGPANMMVLDGDFGPEHPRILWELDIEPTAIERLYKVVVEVRQQGAADPEVVLGRYSLQF